MQTFLNAPVLLGFLQYNFFMKATELERVDLSYAKTLDEVDTLRSTASRLNSTLEHDRDIVVELRNKYKEHQIIAKLETKRAGAEAEAAWAVYKESLQEVRAEEQKMREFQEKADKRRKKLLEAEALSQQDDTGGEELRDRIDELNKEATEAAENKRDLEQQLKLATEPYKAVQRQIKALRIEEVKAEKNVRMAKERLQQKRAEIAAAAGSAETEQARRSQRLQDLEAKYTDGKPKLMEVRQAVNDLHSQYQDKEPDVITAKDRVGELRNQVRRIQSVIGNMESSAGNSLSVFGEKCAAVKQRVEDYMQRGKFQGPVLGPLGAYCKVNAGKEMYAPLAEALLGQGTLDRFIVTTDHDRKLLQDIRKQLHCNSECGVFQIKMVRLCGCVDFVLDAFSPFD